MSSPPEIYTKARGSLQNPGDPGNLDSTTTRKIRAIYLLTGATPP